MRLMVFILFPFVLFSQGFVANVPKWNTHEITLKASSNYNNPYTDVEVWALFINQKGDSLKRPAFWDGGKTWKLRFAPPDTGNTWTWKTFASNETDTGLNNQTGALKSIAYSGDDPFLKNGLLKMSKGHRNVVHHSGKSFLMVAETPWSLPFRATKEQVEIYAKNRQEKGFNTALLLTLQPDTNAEGPNMRNTEQGFKRAFEDLSEGHLNQINTDYFQYYDGLVQTLLAHGIVPVHQPVFNGFGWKGLQVLGTMLDVDEYVRYCKYLLARYGSMPAFWLVSADHDGKDPGTNESGEMFQKWDCYQQPTGIHYNP